MKRQKCAHFYGIDREDPFHNLGPWFNLVCMNCGHRMYIDKDAFK